MVERAGVAELGAVGPALLGERLAGGIAANEARRGVDALDLPTQLELERCAAQSVERELDARRARV
jgi:hypothetical protein